MPAQDLKKPIKIAKYSEAGLTCESDGYLGMTPADFINGRVRIQECFYMDTPSLVQLHAVIHNTYGTGTDNKRVIELEQACSLALRQSGIEHRYDDALAQAAGTVVLEPAPFSVKEAYTYLNMPIYLESDAIQLVQDMDGGPIYALFTSEYLTGYEGKLLKAMNRLLPPGTSIKPMSKRADGTFAKVTSIFGLKLERKFYNSPSITTWESIQKSLKQSADTASEYFKAQKDLSIPFKVLKQVSVTKADQDYVDVLGVVLEPEVVDKTKQDADGSDTGAEGDIYSAAEICKAMEWWMENADQQFACFHTALGGVFVGKEDIILMQNYIAPVDFELGEQNVIKDSWLLGARVKNPTLVKAVRDGKINSWSIGANALGAIEEVEVPKE